MITLSTLTAATLDDTSIEEFEVLLKEYVAHNVSSHESKQLFKSIVEAAIKDVERYKKTN